MKFLADEIKQAEAIAYFGGRRSPLVRKSAPRRYMALARHSHSIVPGGKSVTDVTRFPLAEILP
jgi:hypothetical protein